MRRFVFQNLMVRLGTVLLALMFVISCAKKTTEVELIPRDILFGNPEKVSPKLSPDGQRLAYVAPYEGVMNIWVKTVGTDDDQAITHDKHRGIRFYFWAPGGDQIFYVQDRDGDENYHIFSIPYIGGEPTDLTPLENIRAQFVAVDPDFPNEILIGLNDRNPMFHDVHRLDLTTGERKLEVQNDIGAAGWIADHTLTVRIAQLPKPDGGFKLLHRRDDKSSWEPLIEWGAEDALGTGAFAFAKDNQTLYMISSIGANTAELRTFNVQTGEEKTVAKDPDYDIGGLMIERGSYKIQAVRFSKDRAEWKALDSHFQVHLASLRKSAHPGDKL